MLYTKTAVARDFRGRTQDSRHDENSSFFRVFFEYFFSVVLMTRAFTPRVCRASIIRVFCSSHTQHLANWQPLFSESKKLESSHGHFKAYLIPSNDTELRY